MKYFNILLFSVCLNATLIGQNPGLWYGFEDCELLDQVVNHADAAFSGTPACACGTVDSSLVFTGSEALVFPESTKNLLTANYTISFDFRSTNTEPFIDLLSVRKACNQDSAMAIKFLPSRGEIQVIFAQDNLNIVQLAGLVNPDLCWHSVVIVNNQLTYSLYLDNVLVANAVAPRDIPLSRLAPMAFSNSACLGITDFRLEGRIDEFEVFDRALSESEINARYTRNDQIITRDTTIFQGDAFQIRTGKTCASNIIWSPAGSLDDPNAREPIVSPQTSTTYTVRFRDTDCTVEQQLRVNVLDLEDLQCDSLLVPNAFTPNNDGTNDVFGISNTFIVESVSNFEILDRWSNRVFSTQDKNQTWDGNYNGQLSNPGMYLYKIAYTCQGEAYNKVGNFVLIR